MPGQSGITSSRLAPTWTAVARFTASMIWTVVRFNQSTSPATSERT